MEIIYTITVGIIDLVILILKKFNKIKIKKIHQIDGFFV